MLFQLLVAHMPHSRSAEAKKRRTLRALWCGYVLHKSNGIESPLTSANSGGDRHCCDSWEDFLDDADEVSDDRSRKSSSHGDVLAAFDPWFGSSLPPPPVVPDAFDCCDADPWNKYMKPVPPPSFDLRSAATEFKPNDSGRDTLLHTIHLMQALIDRQNDTIAAMSSQLESFAGTSKLYVDRCISGRESSLMDFAHASTDAATLRNRISKVEDGLTSLSMSLKECVQASIDRRLTIAGTGGALPETPTMDEGEFYRLLRPHLDDCIFPAISDSVQKGFVSVLDGTNETIRKYDAILQKQIVQLTQKLEDKIDRLVLKSLVHRGDDRSDMYLDYWSSLQASIGKDTQAGLCFWSELSKIDLEGFDLSADGGDDSESNLQHDSNTFLAASPYYCPGCQSEITSSQCYACTFFSKPSADTQTPGLIR